jgi:hypothetical protein
MFYTEATRLEELVANMPVEIAEMDVTLDRTICRRVQMSRNKRGVSAWVKLNTPWPMIEVQTIGHNIHITPGDSYVGHGRVHFPDVKKIGAKYAVEKYDDRWVLREVRA